MNESGDADMSPMKISCEAKIDVLHAQVRDLQEVVRLLVFHVGNKLTDSEASYELDEAALGTPMQRI